MSGALRQLATAFPDVIADGADSDYSATDLDADRAPRTRAEAIVALAIKGPGRRSGRFTGREGDAAWS